MEEYLITMMRSDRRRRGFGVSIDIRLRRFSPIQPRSIFQRGRRVLSDLNYLKGMSTSALYACKPMRIRHVAIMSFRSQLELSQVLTGCG